MRQRGKEKKKRRRRAEPEALKKGSTKDAWSTEGPITQNHPNGVGLRVGKRRRKEP